MKNSKFFVMMGVILAMGLAACNSSSSEEAPESVKPAESVAPSSQIVTPSSQAAGQSSQGGQQQQSSQGGQQQSSQGGQQQSSQGGQDQSSQAGEDQSSRNPWGGQSGWAPQSSQPAASSEDPDRKSIEVSSFAIEKKDDNKVYLKIEGTQANHSADEFKWAWGLASGSGQNISFIFGKAEPEADDYVASTFNENNEFAVELNLSDIDELVVGQYTIYGGTPDTYGAISPLDADSSAEDDNFKYYINEQSQFGRTSYQFVVDALPVIDFETAVVYNPGDDLPDGKQEGIYVKIGGAVKAGTVLEELTVKASFQRVSGNQGGMGGNTTYPSSGWNQPAPAFPEDEMFWTEDRENNKAYINLYIGFMNVNEKWMTRLGFNTADNPNCYMINDIEDVEYRFADEEINKVYTVNAKASELDGDYQGCLGFAVTKEHQKVPTQNDPHTWDYVTDGDKTNSDGKVIKNYTCSDDGCGAIAAGIAFEDYDEGDAANIDSGSDVKIKTSTTTHWKIVAPKAGACKLMMASRLTQNYFTYPDQRNNDDVPFNTGYEIKAGDNDGVVTMIGKTYEGDCGLNGDDFVYYEVGTLTVAEGENIISFTMPSSQSFRLAYGGEVRLVFEA